MEKNLDAVLQRSGLSRDQINSTRFLIGPPGPASGSRAEWPPIRVLEAIRQRVEKAQEQVDVEENHRTDDAMTALDDVLAILAEVLP